MPGILERCAWTAVGLVALSIAGMARAEPADVAPVAVIADRAGTCLYVGEANVRKVAIFDLATGRVRQTICTSGPPTGLALSPDGRALYVTCEGPEGIIDVIDLAAGRRSKQLIAGHTPMAPLLSADGKRLFVCSRFRNRVELIDTASGQVEAQIPVVREPVAAALTPDGTRLFVANHLASGPADGPFMAAVVSVIDVNARKVTGVIQLPNGSMSLRGMCLSPDGKQAFVTHLLARYQVPTTQLDRGWMNTNAVSVIDTTDARLVNTVLLDDIDLGAANPWGVACTADGRYLCVAHAGTHEISVIDRAALLDKLTKVAAGQRVSEVSATAADVPDDLSFMAGVRTRAKLAGNGPRGLVVVGTKIYAAEYFSDSLGMVDLDATGGTAKPGKTESTKESRPGPAPGALKGVSFALGARKGGAWPASLLRLGMKEKAQAVSPEARRGEMLFNDATMSFQHWQSCASCHPDGRADGPNWDLMNDGIGSPKNTKSMLRAPETPPLMSLGIRASSEIAIAAGIRYVLFAERPKEDTDAINAYFRSMQPVPSPYLIDGKLSPKAERGRKVFETAGCAHCHPSPLFTDNHSYNVGTGLGNQKDRLFDTPTLIEVWRTAPYLHDGRAATMEEVFKKSNPNDRHGRTSELSAEDFAALIEYVLSL